MARHKKIGEILIDSGLISEETVDKALEEQKTLHLRLGEILIKKGYISPEGVIKALARQYKMEVINIHDIKIPPHVVVQIPESMIRKHLILPVKIEKRNITIAMWDPLNMECLREVEFYTGLRTSPVLAPKETIMEAIEYYYRFLDGNINIKEIISTRTSERDRELANIEGEEFSPPIIKLVNMILIDAIESRASDIHIEPFQNSLIIRFRIDGVMIEKARMDRPLQQAIISRLKILSNLDIAEKRLPQDGGFRVRIKDREVDLRLSTLPVVNGEKVVIRILDRTHTTLSIDDLGFSEREYGIVEKLLARRRGIILITGPTGSGKTTTLYAFINRIKTEGLNIVTIEDPVEYMIEGINQVQVKPDIGLTFARCLRSILRQDPDVILVGEIRDIETAEMCLRAALTGHLVLSTLHTGDGASTITRLVDLKIPPYILASTVEAIISQRLVRILCNKCKKKGKGHNMFEATGCYRCNHTGYYGRTGIFEIFLFTQQMRRLIVDGASEEELREFARREGIRSLMDNGEEKLYKGLTTHEEIYRVIE